MTDEEYSKLVYALWQASLENSDRANAVNEQVSTASTALRNASNRLPDELKQALQKALPSAAENAAKMIASQWTQANTHAERATAAYKDATAQARKIILTSTMFIFGILIIGLITFGISIFKRIDELASLQSDKDRLEAIVQQLTLRGGYANVKQCYDTAQRPRLCVRVDEKAKTSDKRWQVIKGY